MDEEAVAEYVNQSQQVIDSAPEMNEETTKMRLVVPFLELLGWDRRSMEAEYAVPIGSSKKYVDYALTVGGSPVVFVEAKPVQSELTDKNVEQLRSYMRQELAVDWGVLTNGQCFEVLSKRASGHENGELSVAQFDLNGLAKDPGVLDLLSKESIQSGRADDVARQIAEATRAIQTLEDRGDKLSAALAETIESEIEAVPLDTEEQARGFVDDLVSVLREKRQFMGKQDSGGDSPIVDPPPAGSWRQSSRQDIEGAPDATVAVFPTKESGLDFVEENDAWGFVRIGREIDYAAMYVTGDVQEIKYFAEVADVVSPEEADLAREPTAYQNDGEIADAKRVVVFEPESIVEFSDPIPFESKYPQGRRYTTLEQIRTAKTTDDVL